MIIYPAIDLRRGRVVRLTQGRPEAEQVYGDDPLAVARRWAAAGASWLHLINLDGALEATEQGTGQPSTAGSAVHWLQTIRGALPGISIQFGGGMRTLAAVERALESGASRVIVGTMAVERPDWVGQVVRRFGPNRIAVALDVQAGQVSTHGWTRLSARTAAELGRSMQRLGVRHALHTDTHRDGTLSGVDAEAAAALARETELEIIVAGGVATLEDLGRLRRYEGAGIGGVVIGQALYQGKLSLAQALQAAEGGGRRAGHGRVSC